MDRARLINLSKALAYFSKSLFAISDIYSIHQCCNSITATRACLDTDQLFRVFFVDVFELLEIGFQSFELRLMRADFTRNVGMLRIFRCPSLPP